MYLFYVFENWESCNLSKCEWGNKCRDQLWTNTGSGWVPFPAHHFWHIDRICFGSHIAGRTPIPQRQYLMSHSEQCFDPERTVSPTSVHRENHELVYINIYLALFHMHTCTAIQLLLQTDKRLEKKNKKNLPQSPSWSVALGAFGWIC